MSLSSFMFQGAVPPAVGTGSDASQSFPLWLQGALAGTIGAASQVASQPFSPYPGPTVASQSAPTVAAQNLAQQNVGQFNPMLQAGANSVQAGSGPVNQGDVTKFLNPYQDYVSGALNRNLQNNILPSVQDKFVSAGQSRSPQEANLTRNAVYDTQQAVGQSMANNYQGALGALMQQRGQQIQGGQTMGQMGALGQEMGARDVGQLAAAGQSQDTQNQANINAGMTQFQQQQQWPYQNLSWLSNIINGLPTSQAGSTSQQVNGGYLPGAAYGASPFNQFLGALGKYNAGGGGFRHGGAVVVPFRSRGGALSRSLAMAA